MARVARIAGNVGLFGLWRLPSRVTCFTNSCRSQPSGWCGRPKLERLKERSDDYDTLFLGSSRIYHQIIPQLYDRLTGERGIATKSFNAAVDGMRPWKTLKATFDQILKFRPKHLRWVFIELGAIRVPVDPKETRHEPAGLLA